MSAKNWAERRQEWVEKKAPKLPYPRIDEDIIGRWPELYDDNGTLIVSGLYFPPNAENRVSASLTWSCGIIILALFMPSNWLLDTMKLTGTNILTAIIVLCAIATYLIKYKFYHKFGRRVSVRFLQNGDIECGKHRIAANMRPSFESRPHELGSDEEREEQHHIRRYQGDARPKPRHFRDATQVFIAYGPGGGRKIEVASIGADVHMYLANLLRSALAHAHEKQAVRSSALAFAPNRAASLD